MAASRQPSVLLVEDGAAEALLIEIACRRCGAHLKLSHVLDAHVAIEYLEGIGRYADRQTHPLPDLIVLDIHMPKMSGLEFLGWLREQPDHHHRPVVMFTASVDPDDRGRAFALGAQGFLEKPSGMAELMTLVKSLDAMSRGESLVV